MPGSPVVTVEFARSARARRRRFASTAPPRPATAYTFCSSQCGQHTRATNRPPRLLPADYAEWFRRRREKRNVVVRRHAYIYIYIRICVFYFWLVLAHSLVRPIVIPPSRTLAPAREIRPAQRAPPSPCRRVQRDRPPHRTTEHVIIGHYCRGPIVVSPPPPPPNLVYTKRRSFSFIFQTDPPCYARSPSVFKLFSSGHSKDYEHTRSYAS